MSNYPECERMAAVSERSQEIGDFLEWLAAQGVHRMRWETVTDERECSCLNVFTGKPRETCHACDGTGTYEVSWETWVEDRRMPERLLAEYFNIDLGEVERERRALLDSLNA